VQTRVDRDCQESCDGGDGAENDENDRDEEKVDHAAYRIPAPINGALMPASREAGRTASQSPIPNRKRSAGLAEPRSSE
jgi:hypothetical protein